ncbi:hypothetical protein PR202_ga14856 [Eleusine coracana subsp. coracana]|uniref:Uncharacterized protein n=1 Tax=Eleusine coracana subsp. coracana TaxID=191504 RepID=A0AAV5CIE1_ELECO|nr:hypothetical protein PR202_ga14856 [Eleusine coracana subsp. coracana]
METPTPVPPSRLLVSPLARRLESAAAGLGQGAHEHGPLSTGAMEHFRARRHGDVDWFRRRGGHGGGVVPWAAREGDEDHDAAVAFAPAERHGGAIICGGPRHHLSHRTGGTGGSGRSPYHRAPQRSTGALFRPIASRRWPPLQACACAAASSEPMEMREGNRRRSC